MVHGFAKNSNGSVSIDSKPGLGTTVRLYLPRDAEGHSKEVGQSKTSPKMTVEAGKTVLVVDDEPILRKLLIEMLRDLGYGVIEAADGAEALCVLQSTQEVDLLVTDIGLPGGMDGRQLADAALALRSDLKILFITGYAENEIVRNGVLEPNMQVVTKPFPLKVLAAKIQNVI